MNNPEVIETAIECGGPALVLLSAAIAFYLARRNSSSSASSDAFKQDVIGRDVGRILRDLPRRDE